MPPFRARMSTLSVALICACLLVAPRCVEAKPKPRVPEKLDGVVDDEEDEEYKRWGMTKRQLAMEKEMEEGGPPGGGGFDLSSLTNGGGGLDAMAAASSGTQMTFVKLAPPADGSTRTKKDVDELSGKWATLLRSGGMSESLYAIDVDTVLITLPDGKYMSEVREFLWQQEEVENFEWNSQVWKKGESVPTPRKTSEDAMAPKRGKKRGKRGRGKKKRRANEDGGKVEL